MRKLFWSGVVVGGLLLLWAAAIEPRLLVVRHYRFSAPGLENIRMVWVSDLHLAPGERSRLQKLVAEINRQRPDVVLVGGDLANGHVRRSSMPAAEIAAGLSEIRASYGIFAVLGNHDTWYGKREMAAALQQNRIKVLQNEGQAIKTGGGSFYLAGVEDFDTGHPDIERALTRSEGPVILLSHSPDVFPAVPPQVVLTLAGHTHGGQIYIPGIGAPVSSSVYGQRYIRGLIEEDGRQMLVTVGIGTSVLPLRFGSVPEIVVIDWQKNQSKI